MDKRCGGKTSEEGEGQVKVKENGGEERWRRGGRGG